jgi:hypothetical protein
MGLKVLRVLLKHWRLTVTNDWHRHNRFELIYIPSLGIAPSLQPRQFESREAHHIRDVLRILFRERAKV